MEFYDHLAQYYTKCGEVIRGESEAAGIFPNYPDRGMAREGSYLDFLAKHVPSSAEVLEGGFLFDQHGGQSHQIDVIVTSDVAPRFQLLKKAFACIDGTIAVVAIKSKLTRAELHEAIDNLRSLPKKMIVNCPQHIRVRHYDDWPYKIIFASDGVSEQAVYDGLNNYITTRGLRFHEAPNLIHVAGKAALVKLRPGLDQEEQATPTSTPELVYDRSEGRYPPDPVAMLHAVANIQVAAFLARHIGFQYFEILNKVRDMFVSRGDGNG